MMWMVVIVLGVLALVVVRSLKRNAQAQAEAAKILEYQEQVAANQQFDVPVSRIANEPGRLV